MEAQTLAPPTPPAPVAIAPAQPDPSLGERLGRYLHSAHSGGVAIVRAEGMGCSGIRLAGPVEPEEMTRDAGRLGDGVLYVYPRPFAFPTDALLRSAEALRDADVAEGVPAPRRHAMARLLHCLESVGSPVVSVGYLRQGIFHHVTLADEEAAELMSEFDAAMDEDDDEFDEELWDLPTDEAAERILEEVDRMDVPDDVRRSKPRIVAQDAARSIVGPEPLSGMRRERVHQAVLLAADALRRGH